jgi:hypothetical protein
VEVEGTGKFPPKENLWNIILEFEVQCLFANGVRFTCKTDKPLVRFEGTEGWVQVRYPTEIETHPESLLSWKPGPNDLTLPYKTSEKRDFLDAVKSRGQTQADAEVGHRNTSLAHLGLVAIDLGRKIKWDPKKEQCVGDDEANERLKPKPPRGPWQL